MADDGDIRVGDDERRAVDARLQRAHGEGRLSLEEYEERSSRAWAARTRADLAGLTTDLPPDGTTAVVPASAAGRADVSTDRHEDRTLAQRAGSALGTIAVVGLLIWGGSQVVGADDASFVFGSGTVTVADDADRAEIGLLFGSTTVIVPDDARVTTSGWRVFGSASCDQACAGTGTRPVAVDVSGAFGSADIMTRSEAAAKNASDGDRPGRDRDDDD